jgi:hypothetical protein
MDETCSAKGQRQTTAFNYEISTMSEMKPWTTPQKGSRSLKPYKQYYHDDACC